MDGAYSLNAPGHAGGALTSPCVRVEGMSSRVGAERPQRDPQRLSPEGRPRPPLSARPPPARTAAARRRPRLL